jgi:hypothetical protein
MSSCSLPTTSILIHNYSCISLLLLSLCNWDKLLLVSFPLNMAMQDSLILSSESELLPIHIPVLRLCLWFMCMTNWNKYSLLHVDKYKSLLEHLKVFCLCLSCPIASLQETFSSLNFFCLFVFQK